MVKCPQCDRQMNYNEKTGLYECPFCGYIRLKKFGDEKEAKK